MGSSTGKKGGKKFGRDRVKCARYRAQGRLEKNKAKRIEKERRRQERFKARGIRNKSESGHGERGKKDNDEGKGQEDSGIQISSLDSCEADKNGS